MAFAPGWARLDLMAASAQFGADPLVDAILDPEHARACVMWIKGRREMCGRKSWRLDRLLHVHAEIDQVQKELQRPLILLVTAGRAEGEERIAVAGRD